MKKLTLEKIKRKIRGTLVSWFRECPYYYYGYASYRTSKNKVNKDRKSNQAYFAAKPNPGAGIGHQMANWIAGYCFAKKFNLYFAHIPFSDPTWEKFLGFYRGEKFFNELKREGFKIVRIPLFDENNESEITKIRKIIDYYGGKKVIILAEQDQFYRNQYDAMEVLQKKFYSCPDRVNDKLIFEKENINIAVHVRRGDILQNGKKENPNLTMRFQGNDYFEKALNIALSKITSKESIHIYIFSQGNENDFAEFKKYDNVHFCLDMNAKNSFLHMVNADILITSKSSFSYKPALLNKGIKICPENFWHGYPQNQSWILLNDAGEVISK